MSSHHLSHISTNVLKYYFKPSYIIHNLTTHCWQTSVALQTSFEISTTIPLQMACLPITYSISILMYQNTTSYPHITFIILLLIVAYSSILLFVPSDCKLGLQSCTAKKSRSGCKKSMWCFSGFYTYSFVQI